MCSITDKGMFWLEFGELALLHLLTTWHTDIRLVTHSLGWYILNPNMYTCIFMCAGGIVVGVALFCGHSCKELKGGL